MKIRHGFVSNSSSSSFVCDVCGETFHGYDSSLEDFELFECVNGHTVCIEHTLKELTINGEEADENYGIDEECCPICMYEDFSYDDAKRYLKEKYEISEEEVFEEIKKVNKRRKKLYSAEYVNFVFQKYGITDDSFLKEIKEMFPCYRDYLNYKKEEK